MWAQAQSVFLGKLGYLLLLLLVEESLSLCVLDDDGMNCTNSSLLLVSRTELKENGYSIIVNQLPNISTNCTTLKKEINAKMGGSYLQLDYLDKDKTSVEITVPDDIGSEDHVISISYAIDDPKCCNMKAVFDHGITLKVIDEPHVIHESNNPNTLQCLLHSQDPDVWIEFVLNDNVLGYCGQFTSPVEHKNDILIRYDSSRKACILKINKLTEENEGVYLCSVMVPYPDGNGFLKINSTTVTLLRSPNNAKTIGIMAGITATGVTIAIIVVITVLCICRRKQCHCLPRQQQQDQEEPEPLEPLMNDKLGGQVVENT